MHSRRPVRVLLSAIVAGLAALVLASRVFVDVNLVRVPVLAAPATAKGGVVRAKPAERSRANELLAPFAVTARITSSAAGSFTIAVDGVTACTHDVAAGKSRRVDCAVTSGWNPPADHEVVVQGPSGSWTIDSLELSTHHGRNGEPNAFLILPAGSDHYLHPSVMWVIGTWVLLFAAFALFPRPPSMPPWVAIPYRLVASLAVLELAVSAISPFVSSYRVVLSAQTFATLLIVILLPRLWSAMRVKAFAVAVVSSAAIVAIAVGVVRYRAYSARGRLLAELQPVALKNCEFKRFGETNDGGYVLCANLLGSVQSAYSYGISGYDQWGCDVSRRLSVPMHEYDCFDLRAPACPSGRAIFHPECVGPQQATIEGRLFDSPQHQFEKNGDADKHLVMKMDVEMAEWDTLGQASDATLDRIDQIAIELHGVEEPERYLAVIKRLKQFFYVASLHFNNFACQEGIAPFPAWAYEALFVNKRIAVPGTGPAVAPRSELAPNNPQWSDCQSTAALPQKK